MAQCQSSLSHQILEFLIQGELNAEFLWYQYDSEQKVNRFTIVTKTTL
jgi:hypothetical protein